MKTVPCQQSQRSGASSASDMRSRFSTSNPIQVSRQVGKALTKSERMARIRSRDTQPELVTRSLLHRLGYRFRVNVRSLPGTPDIANKRQRLAILVHGCFWHLHPGCVLARRPRRNTAYWEPKLQRNVERDAEIQRELRQIGYRVLVVWECETRKRDILQRKLSSFMLEQSSSG